MSSPECGIRRVQEPGSELRPTRRQALEPPDPRRVDRRGASVRLAAIAVGPTRGIRRSPCSSSAAGRSRIALVAETCRALAHRRPTDHGRPEWLADRGALASTTQARRRSTLTPCASGATGRDRPAARPSSSGTRPGSSVTTGSAATDASSRRLPASDDSTSTSCSSVCSSAAARTSTSPSGSPPSDPRATASCDRSTARRAQRLRRSGRWSTPILDEKQREKFENELELDTSLLDAGQGPLPR